MRGWPHKGGLRLPLTPPARCSGVRTEGGRGRHVMTWQVYSPAASLLNSPTCAVPLAHPGPRSSTCRQGDTSRRPPPTHTWLLCGSLSPNGTLQPPGWALTFTCQPLLPEPAHGGARPACAPGRCAWSCAMFGPLGASVLQAQSRLGVGREPLPPACLLAHGPLPAALPRCTICPHHLV